MIMNINTNIRSACTKYPKVWDALKLLAILAALVAVVALVRRCHPRSASGGGAPGSWLTAREPTVQEGFGLAPYVLNRDMRTNYSQYSYFSMNWATSIENIDHFYKDHNFDPTDFYLRYDSNFLKIYTVWDEQTYVLFNNDKSKLLLDHPSIKTDQLPVEANSFKKLISEVKQKKELEHEQSDIDKHLFKLTESNNEKDVRMLPEFTCRYDQYIRFLNGHLEMLYPKPKEFFYQYGAKDASGNIHVSYGLINLFLDDEDYVTNGLQELLILLHNNLLKTDGKNANYHDNVEREIILSNMLFVVPEMKKMKINNKNTNIILPVLFKTTGDEPPSVKDIVGLEYEYIEEDGKYKPAKGISYNELKKPNQFHQAFAKKPNFLNYQIKGFRETVSNQLKYTFSMLINIGYLSIQHLIDENFNFVDDTDIKKTKLRFPVWENDGEKNYITWYYWYGHGHEIAGMNPAVGAGADDYQITVEKKKMILQKKTKRGSESDQDFEFIHDDGDFVKNLKDAAGLPENSTKLIESYVTDLGLNEAETAKKINMLGFMKDQKFSDVEIVEPIIWARQYMQRVNQERRKELYDQIFNNFRVNIPAIRNFMQTFKYVRECLDDSDKCSLIFDMLKDLPIQSSKDQCSSPSSRASSVGSANLELGEDWKKKWNNYKSKLYKSVVEIGIKEFMLELANRLLENRTEPLIGDVSSFLRTARSSYELKSSLDLGDFYY